MASTLVPALAGFIPDFSFSVDPSLQAVAAGGVSTNYTVTVLPTNGFIWAVTLSASGLPSGSTYSFNPASVAGSGSSILSVTTPGGTVAGVYPFTITGTNGSLGHTASATLVVGPPPAPNQISPSGAGQSTTPTYTFNTVPGATYYQVYVSGTGMSGWYTAAQVDPGNTGTGTIPQVPPLAPGSQNWQVQAQNGFGIGPWSTYSTAWNFSVGTGAYRRVIGQGAVGLLQNRANPDRGPKTG